MREYRRIVVNGEYYYGKHLIASIKGCNDNILDKEQVGRFLQDVADIINMVRFGHPVVERFGEGIEVGLSGVQLIETSAITIHTNDMARDLYLDVFSCKDFAEASVIQFVQKQFTPKSLTHEVLLRR